ncbi:MAG: hypothetical protein EXS36_06725 [Pedosphaera sp.]|nr:hypothetical protein [Pedosphaera sp.]
MLAGGNLVASGQLAAHQDLQLTNLQPGEYFVDAGTDPLKISPNWIRQEFELGHETNTQMTVDFEQAELDLFFSDPAPVDLFDAWGNRLLAIKESDYRPPYKPPTESAPFHVFSKKLSPSIYRVRMASEATNSLHFEARDESIRLLPGKKVTKSIELIRWSVPKLHATWVNSFKTRFLLVKSNPPFLAARTETTIGEFEAFATNVSLPLSTLVSATANGFVDIGRTWKDAFSGSGTKTNPVVGVS